MWWSSSSSLKSTTTLNNNLIWFASDCVCVAAIYMFCIVGTTPNEWPTIFTVGNRELLFKLFCEFFAVDCRVQLFAADCWVQLFSVSICKTSSAHCWQQLCYDAAVLGDMLVLLAEIVVNVFCFRWAVCTVLLLSKL